MSRTAVRSSFLGSRYCLAPGVTGRADHTGPGTKILERLDRLEQENRLLAEQVRDAARRNLGHPPAAETAPVTVEEEVDIQQQRDRGAGPDQGRERRRRFPIRLAGNGALQRLLNSKQSGGADYPVVAAPTGAGHDGATVRQTIIGLEFGGPQAIWGGKVQRLGLHGFLRRRHQLRHPRAHRRRSRLDWKTRSIMAGLEKPIFNPREPSSLAQVGISPLTGAGNLWLWLPQVRFEQDLRFGANYRASRASGRRADARDRPLRGNGHCPKPRAPRLEGRFNFYHKLDDDRRLEIRRRLPHQHHPRGRQIHPVEPVLAGLVLQSRGVGSNSPASSTPARTWRIWAAARARASRYPK